MLPEIKFHISDVYQEHLKRPAKYKMLTRAALESRTRKLEILWRKHEKSILTEIARAVNLKWQEKTIYVYISYGVGCFSDPLTLSMENDTQFLFHTLTHELIHRILSENENVPITWDNWIKLMRKYRTESFTTRIHVPIHAAHNQIYLKLFGKAALSKEIEYMRKHDPEYFRSWEIVQRDGYKNILATLNDR